MTEQDFGDLRPWLNEYEQYARSIKSGDPRSAIRDTQSHRTYLPLLRGGGKTCFRRPIRRRIMCCPNR